ncbi:MAG: hypothetical protein RML46_05305 [Anaerolineae bacterium]|nr:hypothetical protein [Anaerolineae bacterium]MDW8068311.1 hypothetical protein [Anaerolineae bacterium]
MMEDSNWLERGQWLPPFEAEERDLSEGLEEAQKNQHTRLRRRSSGPSLGGLGGLIGALSPWQRFVLALLLFLNVALLGCMCLVMTGRVVLFPP